MANPYLGEIRMVGFTFPPVGFAFCNGQLLAIAQNQALFALLGTTYGGNGTSTFALPDLRGRVPIHFGNGPGLSPYVQGQVGGTENTNILVTNLPSHAHTINAANGGANSSSPAGAFLGNAGLNATDQYYQTTASSQTTMNAAMVNTTGSGLPINNLQPYLVINMIIALQGIFPSRN
jgi:microcystin-dependent protein